MNEATNIFKMTRCWVIQRGSQLFSEVQGSECHPYGVCIALEGYHAVKAECTCPYDWGGYCKHIVATLLTCMHDEESVSERPTIAATLGKLSREELEGPLLELSKKRPDLTNFIESLALDSQKIRSFRAEELITRPLGNYTGWALCQVLR